MNKKITEHDALKGVDQLIGALTPEEQKRVLDFVISKHKIQASPLSANQTNQQQAFNTQTNTNQAGSTVDGKTIKDFLVSKKPNDFYERITCIVYYIEKIQGIVGVKNAAIIQGNKDARQSPFSNASVFINHAVTRHNYLTPIGGGKKALSARGEAVVEALPDRAAVAEALVAHQGKKKGKRKPRKKKSKV